MPINCRLSVLVVDDEEVTAELLETMLRRIGFEDITISKSGVDALMKLRGRTYGLIISDWEMRPMSGLELLKAVRADERTKDAVFLMVTLHSDLNHAQAAKDAGADHYIVKPFSFAVLREKLERLCPDPPRD